RRGKKKSLLVLDEAHTAAPASASKYAVDSSITGVVRDVSPLFENRLFLSATPHNGHPNSFSALLEILDHQRFTRGIEPSRRQLERVMVRRLKEDLRQAKLGNYPERHVREIALSYADGGRWSATYRDRGKQGDPVVHEAALDDGGAGDVELRLADLLAEYTELLSPRRGRGRLVFVRLQKRLLSSIRAFDRTLGKHAGNVGTSDTFFGQATFPDEADDEYGDEAAAAAAEDHEVADASRVLATPAGRAREVLNEMQRLAAGYRDAPDAKLLALVEWIRRELCPAVRVGGADRRQKTTWEDRRVIVFTEYGDTRHYLFQVLSGAFDGTDDGDERILMFYGGMSDAQREEIQTGFNAPPDEHPVRVLIATDAAREGVNLQAHCADLFHFDVPWNPARMEQRNGRIDRTLQPKKEVRCHYFVYPQRREDIVLRKLVAKVDVIQKELGSLSTVVFDRIHGVLEHGIDETTESEIDGAENVGGREAVEEECESVRDLEALRAEVDEAGGILDASREIMSFRPGLLRRAV
ncbi:MAG: DEAD/DEAH box helicase, partial [bacterium]|nr:DEAD/DEAH box helicase [bacterium]